MNTAACLRVFPQRRYQTIRHFGASACWWAPANGLNSKIDPTLRLLFTDTGLGLNNLRINIGGSVKDDRSDGKSGWPEARNVYSPLREDGSVIDGLYVCGNDQGGFYPHHYPSNFTGINAGRTATFARIAAKHALGVE